MPVDRLNGDLLQRRPLVPKKSVDEQIFNSSQSTSLTFIICLFELGHPNDLNGDIDRRDQLSTWATSMNDLNDDVVVEVDVKEALKPSIFIVQKAAAPKSGVEFRQGSNGTIRSSLATSYDVSRRRARVEGDFRPIREDRVYHS